MKSPSEELPWQQANNHLGAKIWLCYSEECYDVELSLNQLKSVIMDIEIFS